MTKGSDEHSLRDTVLERIEQESITPRPLWHFLLHEWSTRISAVFALCVGGLATALTLYLLDVNRFSEHSILSSVWSTVLYALPWVWMAVFGVAIFYTVHAFRETRRGYRYNSKWLVLLALVLSMLFGSILYAMGLGEKVDDYLLAEAPFYQPLTGYHHGRWMDMHSGVLAGTILDVGDDVFMLHVLSGDMITVHVTDTTVTRPVGIVAHGAKVRVVGTTTENVSGETGNTMFDAYEIRPFFGRGGRMQGRNSEYGWGMGHQVKENGKGMRMNE